MRAGFPGPRESHASMLRSWTACLGEGGERRARGRWARRGSAKPSGSWLVRGSERPARPSANQERLGEPLPGGGPLTSVRRRDPLEIQAREVGHADGHVAPLQGREEFLARPQCAFGLGLGKKRDALVIELQWMVDGVS